MDWSKLKLVYNGDSKWTVGNEDYVVPKVYDEKVILLGGPPNQDLNDVIAHITPNLTYLMFPTGEYKEDLYPEFFVSSSYSTQVYGAFKGLYFNPSPFGTSMANTPNSKDSNPAYENGKRMMFWETMSLSDSYWAWEKRGNSLGTNFAWKPGENCVF